MQWQEGPTGPENITFESTTISLTETEVQRVWQSSPSDFTIAPSHHRTMVRSR